MQHVKLAPKHKDEIYCITVLTLSGAFCEVYSVLPPTLGLLAWLNVLEEILNNNIANTAPIGPFELFRSGVKWELKYIDTLPPLSSEVDK